jgi:RNA polymerase subunit RPABC4/transcription elongation factor Spt4
MRICNKCGAIVRPEKDKSIDYPYHCPNCDENKYEFETKIVEVNKEAENVEPENVCPVCGRELEPIYENNGFDEPNPTHCEIVGYELCDCEVN